MAAATRCTLAATCSVVEDLFKVFGVKVTESSGGVLVKAFLEAWPHGNHIHADVNLSAESFS